MKKYISIFVCVFIVVFSTVLYAKIYQSAEKYLKKIFRDMKKIEMKVIELTKDNKKKIEKGLGYKIVEDNFTFYIGKAKDDTDIYCVILVENGKHGSIIFAVAVTEDGHIKNMAVLESKEVKGAKIAKRRFLRQFTGKTSKDPIRLKRDINAITGATISSNAATRVARKALVVWEELFFKEKEEVSKINNAL